MLINCRSDGGIVRQKPDAPSADEDDTMRREAEVADRTLTQN